MQPEASSPPSFVIKAEDLATLNYLDRNHPRPRRLEWINRGTNQKLRRTSIELLLRTLFREVTSASVLRLHQSSGLRAIFGTDQERERFARAFSKARDSETAKKHYVVSAIFDDREAAERAVSALRRSGVSEQGISLLWRASKFLDADYRWSEGHSSLSVVGAVAGSGIAGAMLGVAILFVPGIGPVATAGILATSALTSVATVSGVIGATGGAVAKMLTDHDVDGVHARYYEEEIRRGKVFVSVDTRHAAGGPADALQILKQRGGRTAGDGSVQRAA